MYNEKKRKVLGTLARNGPMTPPEIAVRTRLYPIKSMYSYMLRLAGFGLVSRGRQYRRGEMVYALTEKGTARFLWLTAGSRPPLHQPQQASFRTKEAHPG